MVAMTASNENDRTAQEQTPNQKTNEGDNESKNTVEMSAEKAYYLQRTQVLGELQQELLKWAKTRFWVVTAVVVLVGFLGSGLLIRETVRTLVEKQIADANTAAIIAKEAATRAALATEEITKQAQTYVKTVTELQEKASQVDAQFVSVRQRLEAESANVKAGAAREAKDITTRLGRLESLVAGLAKQPQVDRQAVAAYQSDIVKLRESAFAEGKRFAENSTYFVSIYYNEKTAAIAPKVVEILTQAGFKASSMSSTLVFRKFSSAEEPQILGLPSTRPLPGNVNRIIYDFNGEAKAKEISEMLRSVVRFSEIRMWTLGDPSEVSPTVYSPLSLSYRKEQRIYVVLAE
jgi:hypothetical protein